MKLIKEIGLFLEMLSFADFIFFFAIIILMVLIVTLIYFIKINNEDELGETQEMKIVEEINKNIVSKNSNIKLTSYEKDQEDKAIISYDELLKQNQNYAINYEEEGLDGDLAIKKVNLAKIALDEEKPINDDTMSFKQEESFLQALKQLQNKMN